MTEPTPTPWPEHGPYVWEPPPGQGRLGDVIDALAALPYPDKYARLYDTPTFIKNLAEAANARLAVDAIWMDGQRSVVTEASGVGQVTTSLSVVHGAIVMPVFFAGVSTTIPICNVVSSPENAVWFRVYETKTMTAVANKTVIVSIFAWGSI